MGQRIGEVHVEENNVGLARQHALDGLLHRPRVADDLETVAELAPQVAREQLVILDEEHADHVRRVHSVTPT